MRSIPITARRPMLGLHHELSASPPTMKTSAYLSSAWSRKSPRSDVLLAILATFPSTASNSPFKKTKRAAKKR